MNLHLRMKVLIAALSVIALASLGIAGTASAKLVGEFTKFQYCPWKNVEVKKCTYAVTEGGEVIMGSKKVPIVNDVVLQGGFGAANKETKFSKFFGATEGKPTLQPVGQPVPGGLAGLVNCPEISNFFLRISCEITFENGLTGLDSTLELARPASEIKISESNLSRKENVALQLPVKVRLENPFLGSNCYVGSESSPIIWNLTSGKTAPPPPNESIGGVAGSILAIEEGLIARLDGNSLVDNAWAAPKASGCGGIFAFILDPIINSAAGLPAAAGTNTARLNNTISFATVGAIKFIDESNP
jgi:hypothetical protein